MTIEWKPIEDAPRDGTVILLRLYNGPLVSHTVRAGAWNTQDMEFPWVFLDDGGELNGMQNNNYGPSTWAEMPS